MAAHALTSRVPAHAVIDDAFTPELADAILARALASEEVFRPTGTGGYANKAVNAEVRRSLFHPNGLGPLRADVEAEVQSLFPELCGQIGITPFPIAKLELQLVAHRDGHFFKAHTDTFSKANQGEQPTNRALSCVGYFFRTPRAFSGGETRILSLDGNAGETVEPRHNRVLAFPSFARHEVLPISVPGDAFADARFTLNCWYHKAV